MNQLQKTFYPSCFDSVDQWLDYRKSARIAQQVCTICEDCTHQYQAEMIKQDRCDRVHGIEWMAYTSRDRKKEDA